MCQPRQHNLFARLFDLTRKKYFVEDRIHLVEVEHQIQLTDIPKERIQYLYEEVYGFQVRQFIIVGIDACAEEEAGVSAVYDLGHVAELDKVGLVFLVAWRNEAVHLLWFLVSSGASVCEGLEYRCSEVVGVYGR
jgi:hypothetical protein